MKIKIREESFKVSNPLIRFENQKKIHLITVKKEVKNNRVYIR